MEKQREIDILNELCEGKNYCYGPTGTMMLRNPRKNDPDYDSEDDGLIPIERPKRGKR